MLKAFVTNRPFHFRKSFHDELDRIKLKRHFLTFQRIDALCGVAKFMELIEM